MTEDREDRRFVGGPRMLGAVLPRITRPAYRRRSPAGAQLLADWAEVVGPALAAVTTPRRLSGGALTIACAGPVAMELSHLAPQLLARINGHFGRMAVERLRFVQQAAPPVPRAAVATPPAPLPGRVESALSGLPEGELREALAKLARGVYRSQD